MTHYPLTIATDVNSIEHVTIDATEGHLPKSRNISSKEQYFDLGFGQNLEHGSAAHRWFTESQLRDEQICALTTVSDVKWTDFKLHNDICPLLNPVQFETLVTSANSHGLNLDFGILANSFRLATRFIAHWSSAPFWETVLDQTDGARIVPEKADKSMGVARCSWLHKNELFEKIKKISPAIRHTCQYSIATRIGLIEQVNGNLCRITYNFNSGHSGGIAPKLSLVHYNVENPGLFSTEYLVELHPDLKSAIFYICSFHTRYNWEQGGMANRYHCMVLRFSFFLATILCRAVADVLDDANARRMLWPKIHRKRATSSVWHENSDLKINVAASQIFGGLIYPIGWRLDTAHGLARTAIYEDRETRLVGMEYVKELHETSTWVTMDALDNPLHATHRYFKPEKDFLPESRRPVKRPSD